MKGLKPILLTAIILAVFYSALILILYVSDVITPDRMNEFLTKGGLVWVIIVAAMIMTVWIKNLGQRQ